MKRFDAIRCVVFSDLTHTAASECGLDSVGLMKLCINRPVPVVLETDNSIHFMPCGLNEHCPKFTLVKSDPHGFVYASVDKLNSQIKYFATKLMELHEQETQKEDQKEDQATDIGSIIIT